MQISNKFVLGEHTRFSKQAVEGNIGKKVSFDGKPSTIIDAEIVDDGQAVVFTFDIPDPSSMLLNIQKEALKGLSISIESDHVSTSED